MNRKIEPRFLRMQEAREAREVDLRLQQDMEAELAADVEWYDHPTRGRIRLRDELVHPPGTFPPLDGWEPA